MAVWVQFSTGQFIALDLPLTYWLFELYGYQCLFVWGRNECGQVELTPYYDGQG